MSYPRDLPELEWCDATAEELRKLRLVLIGLGWSFDSANALVGWLLAGAPKDQSSRTLAKYRTTLRELTPPRRSRPERSRRGRIAAIALAGAAATGVGMAHESRSVGASAVSDAEAATTAHNPRYVNLPIAPPRAARSPLHRLR